MLADAEVILDERGAGISPPARAPSSYATVRLPGHLEDAVHRLVVALEWLAEVSAR